ncbi:lipid asymmetry maintenance protein MlaB [Paucibacter sp. Y2R2-4]|uniref:STAS domain-containing protein n=1 Tax=Paucibacter sp. Y2R2-4 TaxID=2893553 RepID=UPI0021E3CE0D|nr:STAS domain-containing protein [Paucibacter sp. Y2R2-4]MCV2349986.1 STAS domain-containing protein [Paucibacter sp. Y2R2-4]
MPEAEEVDESVAREASAAPASLALGPELTIAQAAEQHQRLLEAVQGLESSVLRLDLSNVSDFDSAAIQLLLATQRSLQDKAAELQLHQPSAVVLAALRCYGLDASLKPLPLSPSPAELETQPQEEQPCL